MVIIVRFPSPQNTLLGPLALVSPESPIAIQLICIPPFGMNEIKGLSCTPEQGRDAVSCGADLQQVWHHFLARGRCGSRAHSPVCRASRETE
jgi:hypothetical protein